MFASSSVLLSKSVSESVLADCKEFHEQERVFSVSQIEELGFDQFWRRKDELLGALEAYRQTKRHFLSALLVTDVLRQTSILLLAAPVRFLRRIEYPLIEPGVSELKGVVSRKQQLLPYLTDRMARETPTQASPAEPLTMV